jgi:NTP pyrophosphatase (non-canonical NTP hydrolase)
MDFKKVTERAMEIRDMYDAYEMREVGKVWNRAQIMEGFVGDVGDLMKIVMAKEGLRAMDEVDEKLAHELADCLWCVLVLSHKYGIDIEKEFMKTMDFLEKRIK